jgi:DNA ligase-1
MKILTILNELADTSSKNAKIAILQREKSNETLKAVFKAAYDPTINYYIKKIPPYYTTGGNTLNCGLDFLDSLSGRTVTGNDAIALLHRALSYVDSDDAEVLSRIIQRDLKVGCSESSANKVWKDLIPEFPYMRCSLPGKVKLDSWKWKDGIYSQLKADSLYANLDVVDGIVTLTSRNGKEFPIEKFQQIEADSKMLCSSLNGYRINGELQVSRNGKILPREIGNGILNSVSKGGDFDDGDIPVYSVWDIIPIESAIPKGKCSWTYAKRFDILKSIFATTTHIQIIETKIVYSYAEALEHYFEQLAKGLEGTIIKTSTGTWADNTSKDQVKMKLEVLFELRVITFLDGNGKNADTFGSLWCESQDGLLRVGVGTGLTDDMRLKLFNDPDTLSSIITVKGNNIMPPTKSNPYYSIFLPVFIEPRNDKTVADTLQQIQDQFDNAIKGV